MCEATNYKIYYDMAIFDHGSLDKEGKDLHTHYRQVSARWIAYTQTLDILPFANLYSGDETPDKDFPSWAINWDLPTPTIWARTLPCRYNIIPYDEPRRTRLRRLLGMIV